MSNLSPLFERTHILLGDEGLERLRNANVFLAGLGGVGSYAAEALARTGVGRLTLVDHDVVSGSNMNRQLPAMRSTVGQKKVQVMAARIRDINPDCELTLVEELLMISTMEKALQGDYDFVIDCIDSMSCKVALIATAYHKGIPVASSMGAGNKLDPALIKTGDLMDSEICKLARHVRRRARRLDVDRGVLAVWSTEPPAKPLPPQPVSQGRARAVNGTVSYMPALFGLTLAGAVVQRLLTQDED
ncbi:MAG: tRNA threonylcarbamoyladenosine dehydratase [Gammaproteobacteria bacterium]|nr:tRNA threonylcarbamoyladenosine dehydratase [Gammaproteobacteria bacterium]